ncbi:MAG: citrate lyase acyl carrier protein [Acholeplasmataceae bacterium]
MRESQAGSVESCDCRITVRKQQGMTVEVKSIVYELYGDHIKNLILDTLERKNIKDIYVLCEDKGAVDFVIVSRLATALKRLENSNE